MAKFHPAYSALPLMALSLSGCAIYQSPPRPMPKLQPSALVAPTVGRVIPVFVEVKCVEGCAGLSVAEQPFITRTDVSAIDSNGNSVRALSVDDAVNQAGSAADLAEVASKTGGAAVVAGAGGGVALAGMGQVPLAALDASGGSPLAAVALMTVGVPIVLLGSLGYSAYLAADQEARATLQLESDALPDNPANRGWVFFPAGNFNKVRYSVYQAGATTMRSVGELEVKWVERQPAQAPPHPRLRKRSSDSDDGDAKSESLYQPGDRRNLLCGRRIVRVPSDGSTAGCAAALCACRG